MPVLYRKYRPQAFSEVVGQVSIVKTLQNQVSSGQVAHAYLFVGSRGVGKTSVARILAKAVNCVERTKNQEPRTKSEDGDACGECEVCKAIQNGNYIDLIEIDAASNTGVDNVRELIEHVRFAPSLGQYKVFIIDEVHMLSKGAFNALLKTLEEPPGHAIFILATTEVGKVPATIISRTQRFDFKRLSAGEIEKHLFDIIDKEKMELPPAAVKLVAEHSAGGLRDALSLLDKIFTLGDKPLLDDVLQLIGITDTAFLEKLLGLIAESKAWEIPGFLDTLLEKGADFVVFNRDFLEYLRKVLVLKIIGAAQHQTSLSENHLARAKEFTQGLSENEIILIMRLFLRSLKEQQSAPSPDLPILLASVEAALRKGGNSSSNHQAAAEKPAAKAAPTSAPPKVEVSDSTIKSTNSQEPQPSINNDPPVAIEISQEEVAAKWAQVIEKLKNINGPLTHLLKSSPLERVDGARIIVSVKYKFHKQNLEHPKNQESVSKILKEIYGQSLAIGGEVSSHQEPEKAPAGGLTDALKVFGGELIE